MSTKIIKIKEAILLYNQKRRTGTPRMTQTRLGELVVKGKSKDWQMTIVSHWANGQRFPSPEYLEAICKALDVDANYLLGIEKSK